MRFVVTLSAELPGYPTILPTAGTYPHSPIVTASARNMSSLEQLQHGTGTDLLASITSSSFSSKSSSPVKPARKVAQVNPVQRSTPSPTETTATPPGSGSGRQSRVGVSSARRERGQQEVVVPPGGGERRQESAESSLGVGRRTAARVDSDEVMIIHVSPPPRW